MTYTWKETNKPYAEVIPALLKHLGISKISLGCHSGGTIYALDLLLHHHELLDPDMPYLAAGAPWIHPSHTNSTTMSLVQTFPAGLIGTTDKLAKLFVNHLAPVIGGGINLSMALASKVTPEPKPAEAGGDGATPKREGAAFEAEVWPSVIKRIHAESIQGLSPESVLLMQKGSGWGDWKDYDTLVPRLVEGLRAAGRRLVVDVFYAEKDWMIGDGGSKGPLWFDGCWEKGYEDVIEFKSRTIEGADHDGIWELRWECVHQVLAKVGDRT